MKNKKKWVAVVLTLILPGAGHLYIKEKKKGIFLLAFVLLMSIFTNAAPSILTSVGLLVGYFYSLVSVVMDFNAKIIN